MIKLYCILESCQEPLLFESKTLGVFTAEVVADVISVIFTVILFTFQFKKTIKSIE